MRFDFKKIGRGGGFSQLTRSTFVVNLVHIGQSLEERLALAELLNPSDVYDWYKSELRI